MRRGFRWIHALTLAVACIVAAVIVAQGSGEPNWEGFLVIWLPAVFVVTRGPAARTGRCVRRLRRGPRA